MNNLVIISTQFQLINSIELISKEFKDEKFNAIVFIQNNNHLIQIETVAKKNNINILFKVRYSKTLQYLFIIINSILIGKVDKVIIGNCHDNLMLFIIKLLRFNKLYCVDDGNILDTKDLRPKIDKRHLPVNYFTLHNIDNNEYYDFTYNSYNQLKKSLNKNQITDKSKVILIGQPLVEQGLIDKETFINIIGKINNKFTNLLYILHPRELESKFIDLDNLNITRLDKGVESYLISEEILPSKIIGFYSTALFTISKIFSSSKMDINFVDLARHTKIIHGQVEYRNLRKSLKEILI